MSWAQAGGNWSQCHKTRFQRQIIIFPWWKRTINETSEISLWAELQHNNTNHMTDRITSTRTDLQQFRDDGKHLRVADIDGVVSVRLLLVTNVPQVKDRRQQREDPAETSQTKPRPLRSYQPIRRQQTWTLRMIDRQRVKPTVFWWREGIPPSPWPAGVSRSHASDLHLPPWNSPAPNTTNTRQFDTHDLKHVH